MEVSRGGRAVPALPEGILERPGGEPDDGQKFKAYFDLKLSSSVTFCVLIINKK